MTFSAKAAVFDAYRWVFGSAAGFLALAWKPAGLAAAIHIVIVLAGAGFDWPRVEVLSGPVLVAFGSAFAVAWHRRVLLDETRPKTRGGRIGRYAGLVFAFVFCWSVAFSVASLGAILMGSEDDSVRWLAAAVSVVALYLAARLVTLFPAIALDRRQTAREAWRITRRQGMRLWLGAWFAVLPLVILSRIVEHAALRSGGGGIALGLAGSVTALLIFFLEVAIAVGYASSVYRQVGALGAASAAPSA